MTVINWGEYRMDERAAVEDAQAGDAVAFATLFDTYHGPITRYLYRMVGDRDVADDLAQDTFIKAYRAVARTGEGLNFRAWLYRIATNTALSYHRRRRILQWLPFSHTTVEPKEDLELAERVSEQELVATALKRLKPAQASILLLRHHEGLSLEEIATVLGIRPNAAKVRLFRARKAFAHAYEALTEEREVTT